MVAKQTLKQPSNLGVSKLQKHGVVVVASCVSGYQTSIETAQQPRCFETSKTQGCCGDLPAEMIDLSIVWSTLESRKPASRRILNGTVATRDTTTPRIISNGKPQ